MFDNNGPVAAQNTLRSYVANNLAKPDFPETCREHLEALNAMPVFEALTDGTERLYAALREDQGLPDRPAALLALGTAAQAAAVANLSGKAERWWAIHTWAGGELQPPPTGVVLPEPPEVDPGFTYIVTPAEAPLV